jgi:hypothetical protein
MDANTSKSPLRKPPLRLPGQGFDEKLHDLASTKVEYLVPASFAWMLTIGSVAHLLSKKHPVY